MKHKRCGDFRITDYIMSWITILDMLIFIVVSLLLRLSVITVAFQLLYLVMLFVSIFDPNREWFEIEGGIIWVKIDEKKAIYHAKIVGIKKNIVIGYRNTFLANMISNIGNFFRKVLMRSSV